MNNYLTTALKLFQLSKKEINNARQTNDDELARDASGKAWIATTDALRGFLFSNGVETKKLPKNERQRHEFLAQYGNEKMWILYRSIIGEIHINAYYEGIINYPILLNTFNDVRKFIHRCQNGG